MKHIFKIFVGVLLFVPFTASAISVSWDRPAVGRVNPINILDTVFGNIFTATSTTGHSTFPYASTTALSATTLCLATDCRTVWPTGGGSTFGTTSISATSPLNWNTTTANLSISQSGTGANGYLSSTDFNTFNNKISSTSLSANGGTTYNSSTGVISSFSYPFPSNATSTALTFNAAFTVLNPSTTQGAGTYLGTDSTHGIKIGYYNVNNYALWAGGVTQGASNYGFLLSNNGTSAQFNSTDNLEFNISDVTKLAISNTGAVTLASLASGIVKSTSGLLANAANGTDYTLITAKTCTVGDFVSSVTAAGVFTCTTPAGTTYTGTFPINVTGSVISSLFSTTTNSGMSQGFQYIGSGGIFQSAASSSLFGFTPQPAGNYITALTGDVTATGPGSVAATIGANRVTLGMLSTLAANSVIGNLTGSATTPTAVSTSSLYTGNNGQVLARVGGTWIGVATTTFNSPLAYANGAVSCSSCNTSSASVTSVGLSSTNSTLTVGSSPVTTSGVITADINLAHANSFTALQQFLNASSTLLSAGMGYFGTTSTTTIKGNATSTFSGGINLINGQCFAVGGTCLSSGSSFSGTLGQVNYFNGVNTAVGTSSLFIDITGNIGIGSTTPSSALSIFATTTPFVIYTATSSAAMVTSVTTYTSSQTWTKPAGLVSISVQVIGGGGGGGGGAVASGIGGNGGDGAASSFTYNSGGNTVLANPGLGGNGLLNSGKTAAGGTATGGDTNTSGGAGSAATGGNTGFPSTGGSGTAGGGQPGAGGGGNNVFGNATGGGAAGYAVKSLTAAQLGATETIVVGGGGGGGGCIVSGTGGAGGNASGSTGGTAGSGGGGNACNTNSDSVGGTGGNGGSAGGSSPVYGGGGGAGGKVIVTATIAIFASSLPFQAFVVGQVTSTINGNSTTTPAIGIGTSTPSATFSVQSFWGTIARITYGFIGTINYLFEKIDQYGHLATGGPAPTCGTGCTSVTGDDRTMKVLTGSVVSSITINFANTYTTTPICMVTNEGSTVAVGASTTPTTVVITSLTALTSVNLGLICQISSNFTF